MSARYRKKKAFSTPQLAFLATITGFPDILARACAENQNFALSFSLNFLNVFVHIPGCIWLITLIWASLERSFAAAEDEHR